MEIFYGKNFKFKSHVSFLLLRVIRPVFQSINARSEHISRFIDRLSIEKTKKIDSRLNGVLIHTSEEEKLENRKLSIKY